MNKIKVDFLPTDGNILGFKNIWYKRGTKEAVRYKIDQEQSIKIFPATIFIASKIDAFKGRGQDPRTSQDVEDIIAVLNGNSKILENIKTSDKDIKEYLKLNFSDLSNKSSLSEIIYSHLPPEDKERVDHIKNIIEHIMNL